MTIVQDRITMHRGQVRKTAIADRVITFLEKYPQFNHLSFLASRYMTDWNPKTLLNCLVQHGLSESDLVIPKRGKSYQTAEEVLNFLTSVEIDEAVAFLEEMDKVREVSDLNNALVVEDAPETQETEDQDLI